MYYSTDSFTHYANRIYCTDLPRPWSCFPKNSCYWFFKAFHLFLGHLKHCKGCTNVIVGKLLWEEWSVSGTLAFKLDLYASVITGITQLMVKLISLALTLICFKIYFSCVICSIFLFYQCFFTLTFWFNMYCCMITYYIPFLRCYISGM